MMKNLETLFGKHGFNLGRSFGSKEAYAERYPLRTIVFNANICTREDGKIWHGDIDYTIDRLKLKKIADEIKKNLYVLRELDARFLNARNPLFDKAVITIEAQK